MASKLPKYSYFLVVHDVDAAKAHQAASAWLNTVASEGRPEVFRDWKIVITMLPQGKVVRVVVLGEHGIAGTIIIDMSSSSLFSTIALGEELAALPNSLQLIDSPITQTYMHASDAGGSTLIVVCRHGFARLRHHRTRSSLYDSISLPLGKLGSGHAMKTLNSCIVSSSICALSDSLVTGQKYALDPQTMLDVLNVGTGVCFPTLDTFRRDCLTARYDSGFGLALLVKDLGITEECMAHNEFHTELPSLARRYLADALREVEPSADHTKCLVDWEKRAGVTLKKTEHVRDIPAEDFRA